MKTKNLTTAAYTVVVPGDPTVANNNQLTINCDSTAQAQTITIPAISTFGNSPNYEIIINDKGGVSSTNPITIVCDSGDRINNALTRVLRANGQSVTLNIVGPNDWQALQSQQGLPEVAITANADGLTTATIANGNSIVTVTSANAVHRVTLPAPIPGTIVWIAVGANGFKLRSNAPATVGINGGVGADVVSAVAANILLKLSCFSATQWISESFTAAGVQAAGAVAA